jgi:hypothetical protein
MDEELAKGGELCDVIERISPIEWRKYQSRTLNIDFRKGGGIHEDRTKYPPYTSFRFVVEDQNLVLKLKLVIESYKGRLEWVMNYHDRIALPGRNWVIQPRFVGEVKSEVGIDSQVVLDRYIAEHYPNFGPVAYADLLNLSRHVENAFFGSDGGGSESDAR